MFNLAIASYLFAEYVQALDDRDFSKLENVLASDVEYTFLNGEQTIGPLQGFEQASAFIRRTVEALPGRRTHEIRNLSLVRELADGAEVHASLLRTIYGDDATVVQGHSTGSYDVELAREPSGEWRFRRVQITLEVALPGKIE